MPIDKIVVDLVGLGLIALVVWFFWFSKREGIRVALNSAGVQEALIVVKNGYNPGVLVVKAGKPVRLNFVRQEASPCSEMVVFGAFNRRTSLPEGEIVPVEFVPPRPGEYEFTCQMGMLRGKLVVEG